MALPIDLPGKIICVGLNYAGHAAETGLAVPEQPVLFGKWNNTLIGSDEPIILLGEIDEKIDWEAELAVVIGRTVRNVSRENALEAVRSYACFNDVSARGLQRMDGQWSRGKSPDTFGPIGVPVPASEVPDPQALGIRAIVNGKTMQDSNTADMVFGVAELIWFISRTMTLEPGDLIATGTPGGIGASRKPPIFLEDGDVVTIEIDGLPSLTNAVRAAG